MIAQLIKFGMDLLALEKCRERERWRTRIARWSYLHNFRIFSAGLGDFLKTLPPAWWRNHRGQTRSPMLLYAIIYECRIKILSMRESSVVVENFLRANFFVMISIIWNAIFFTRLDCAFCFQGCQSDVTLFWWKFLLLEFSRCLHSVCALYAGKTFRYCSQLTAACTRITLGGDQNWSVLQRTVAEPQPASFSKFPCKLFHCSLKNNWILYGIINWWKINRNKVCLFSVRVLKFRISE